MQQEEGVEVAGGKILNVLEAATGAQNHPNLHSFSVFGFRG